MLSKQQQDLYLRNIILPEIGEAGQKKLLEAKILVIGAGGLGSSTLQYLACAGIGNIGIIDDDKVEISNLQRQIIHNFDNIGQEKIFSAKEKLQKLSPDLKLNLINQRADYDLLSKEVNNYDVILDCTDNFPTRFIINKVCFEQKKPLIFGAVKGFLGQLSVFKSYLENQPCYACFNPNIVDGTFQLPLHEKGILGAVAGTIGAMQAIYAIKEILNIGNDISGQILFYDFLQNNFRKTKLNKNNNCEICGK